MVPQARCREGTSCRLFGETSFSLEKKTHLLGFREARPPYGPHRGDWGPRPAPTSAGFEGAALRSTAVSGEQWTSPRLISAHLFTASPVPLCTCRLPRLGLRAPALCLGSFCTCLLPCPGQLGEAGLSPPVTPLADACETGRVWNA